MEPPPQEEPKPVVIEKAPVVEEKAPVVEEKPAPVVEDTTNILTFTKDGNEYKVKFAQSPFGMTYMTGKMPIEITKLPPGSYAQDVGVRVGMILIKIEGAAVPDLWADADAA